MTTAELTNRLRAVRLLIADVDGVFTDGGLYIGGEGGEYKRFHVLDGAGVALLNAVHFPLCVISGRYSAVTAQRMRELGLEANLYQGNLAKIEPYEQIKTRYQLRDDQIAYIGDDLVDVPLLRRVGLPVCVANSCDEVKSYALYITRRPGGSGAVREVIELLLKAHNRYEEAVALLTRNTYKDT